MTNRYLFGSKMLELDNCRDEDWLTFVDDYRGDDRKAGERSLKYYKKIVERFTEGKNRDEDFFKSCYLYQTSCGFFDDEAYPFNDFNILEHKTVWIRQLKGYMDLDATEIEALKGETLPKYFYHILYQYYMITENTHRISDGAKANVQKIHDLEMPREYFNDLKNMINILSEVEK